MQFDQQAFMQVGKQSIRDDAPCGDSVRYDADFQQLEEEIGKLEALNAAQVDWAQVIVLSQRILNQQSKDLLVACYLSQALLKQYGLSGLIAGLQILVDMTGLYWQQMQPPVKRLRARNSALQWLSEQAPAELEPLGVDQQNANQWQQAYVLLDELLTNLEQHTPTDSASMLELNKVLKYKKKQAQPLISEATASSTADNSDKEKVIESATKPATPPVESPIENTTGAADSLTHASSDSKTTPESLKEEDNYKHLLQAHDLFNIGSQAINEQSPSGIAAKYEPEFEALEAQLARQEALNAQAVDWQEVKKLASKILTEQSKDLLVSAYLSKALVETEGYTGLLLALHINYELITHFWPTCFPLIKRLRARESALNWFSEKLGSFLEQQPPKETEHQLIIYAYDLLYELINELDTQFEGSGPSLLELSKPLKQYQKMAKASLLKKQQQQQEPSNKTEQAALTKAAQASSAPPASSDNAADESSHESSSQAGIAKDDQQSESIKKKTASNVASKNKAATGKTAAALTVQSINNDNEAKKALRSIQEATRASSEFYLQQQ